MIAATEASVAAFGAIVVAGITAVGVLINTLLTRGIRHEVRANGGNSDTAGDRIVRLERLFLAHQSAFEDFRAETRIQFTNMDLTNELERRRLQDRDTAIAADLREQVARLDTITGTPATLAAAITPPGGIPVVPSKE